MATLLLLKYNNYFNRIVKKEDTVENYLTGRDYSVVEGVNFVPANGILTEQIINWNESFVPDYCIVLDELNNIVSRWFIVNQTRTRGGQYQLTLKRDTIVDNYEAVTTSPCLIEKATITNQLNPLILNKEDFNSNQIKTSETLLCDNTKCSWLVIYYNKSKKASSGEWGGLAGSVVNPSTVDFVDLNVPSITDWEYYQYQTTQFKSTVFKRFRVDAKLGISQYGEASSKMLFDYNCNLLSYSSGTLNSGLFYDKTSLSLLREKTEELLKENKNAIQTALDTDYDNTVQDSSFFFFNNKIVKAGDRYYRVSISPIGTRVNEVGNLTSGNTFNAVSSSFKEGSSFKEDWGGNFNNAIFKDIIYQPYKMQIVDITSTLTIINYDFRNIKDVTDSQYGIIALAYKSYNGKQMNYKIGSTDNLLDPQVAELIAQDLASKGVGTDKAIFDIQILPYCPVTTIKATESTNFIQFSLSATTSDAYDPIYNSDSTQVMALAVYPDKAKFTLNINEDIAIANDYETFKTDVQCTFYRICSPNYNGIFEFSPSKNGGVRYFNVDCTYKPYQPYIHVNPDFAYLYGQDFNDPRGLICGGDFSMTVITSAWETYKLQNKNYQEIFNRQIENLDFNNQLTREKQVFDSVIGLVGSGVGSTLNYQNTKPTNRGGFIEGAVSSMALSAISSAYNYSNLKRGQAENRDYTIDIHNFNLQNIQASPDSLSKVDVFNNNNKIFPVLEKYDATLEERAIFKNKLKYEGMTINAIGTISDYILPTETFIKGQIIRFNNFNDSNEVAQDIYNEISKGVYI